MDRVVCVLGMCNFQFLSFSSSFQQKSCQIIGFCPKHRGWHPLLRLGIPVSIIKQFLTITATVVRISFIASIAFTNVVSTDDPSAGRMRCACHRLGDNVVWSCAVILRTRLVAPLFTNLDTKSHSLTAHRNPL